MFTVPYKDIEWVVNKYGSIVDSNEAIIIESLKNIFGLYLRNQIVAYYDEHPGLTKKHYKFQYMYWDRPHTIIVKAAFPLEAYYLILMNDRQMMRSLYQTELEDINTSYLVKIDDEGSFDINIEPLLENYLCHTDGLTFSEFTDYYKF